jgi:hypothetical protein
MRSGIRRLRCGDPPVSSFGDAPKPLGRLGLFFSLNGFSGSAVDQALRLKKHEYGYQRD